MEIVEDKQLYLEKVKVRQVTHGCLITDIDNKPDIYRVFATKIKLKSGVGVEINIPKDTILLENMRWGTFRAVPKNTTCTILIAKLIQRKAIGLEINEFLQ